MIGLELLLRIAGVIQLGILIASYLVPKVLNWHDALLGLPKLIRQVIWVHGAFIVLVIVSFGLLSVIVANDLAQGTRLARGVCGIIAIFWLARLGVQCFVFDTSECLNSRFLKWGYRGLTVAFVYLTVIYGWATLG